MIHEEISPPRSIKQKPWQTVSAWISSRRWFVVVVIIPTLLGALYYGLIASDVYISESRFVIKNPSQRQTQMSTLANLIQTTGLSAGQEQTNEILDYIGSRDALKDLQKRVDMRKKFTSQDVDFLSRYPQFGREDRFENLFKYYDKMVSAQIDHESGNAILSVKAFNPRDAYEINTRLLNLSEGLVNRLNDRAQRRAITEAERRVMDAQRRLLTARLALREYRNKEELIDPIKQASGVLEISNQLIAEQSALRTQVELMERVAPSNPAIPSIRARIAAIGNEISNQTGRVVGTRSGIASKLGRYENLLAEQEFATQTVTAANASLEQARGEALRQQFYLERVVEPNMPDMALLPHRFTQILVIAGAALCLYFIGWMLIVGILEHSPED